MNQEKDRKKVICPKCNSDKVARILYGYPSPEGMKRVRSGEYVLGGCVLGDHFWYCWNCEHEW